MAKKIVTKKRSAVKAARPKKSVAKKASKPKKVVKAKKAAPKKPVKVKKAAQPKATTKKPVKKTAQKSTGKTASKKAGRSTKAKAAPKATKPASKPVSKPKAKPKPASPKAKMPAEAPAAVPAPAPAPVSAPAPVAASAPAPVVVSSPAVYGDNDEVIPMDRMRQLISDHMVRSKLTSPHVTSVAEADVTGIVKLRDKVKAAFEKREGFKLTFTPFFAKAALDGIKAYPMVNVSVDGKNIIRHKRLNLSFATALDDGNLIVPVIKNADALNVTGLGRAVFDLSTRARTKKLAPDDVQGGTFTITNVGSFGSLFGTPVINQPQTAIMGIGAIQKRPVVREIDGQDVIVIRQMVYLSLTYDHRVIDGALATQCLAAICKSLEKMNEQTVDL